LKGGTARAARRVPKVHKKVFKFSLKVGLQMSHPVWYTYSMMIETDMKNKNETTDFIVTTTSGTRWAATGTSPANVRENFWMRSPSVIAKVEAGRLFTHEEDAELKREKLEEMCR
jgi:hypothetical protein